jgi:hypothetical protein
MDLCRTTHLLFGRVAQATSVDIHPILAELKTNTKREATTREFPTTSLTIISNKWKLMSFEKMSMTVIYR